MIFKTVQIQKCVGYILPENIFVIKNGKKVKLSKGTKINQQIKNILVSNGFKQISGFLLGENDLDENKSQNIANVISENVNILDGIIHNAAIIGKMSSIHDFDLKTWNKVINTNLTSTYLLTKYLTPLMTDSENPRVIFTSSGVVRRGRAFWGAYAISKTAVKSLAEILNDELEPITNIKVFNFDPGATRTSMRAFAYPAENASTLKEPSSLMKYYLWMLSKESSKSDTRYIEFTN